MVSRVMSRGREAVVEMLVVWREGEEGRSARREECSWAE